ncbi:DUF2254 domain-containing protein [Pedobacter deserti]|uniref:DUF2254 domain-containing protein n=1 Tax=Pedobacter deserti TaxID=2817382 RepID=UPI00210BB6D0|nr:DUF2254 domain-containing protein [Pedobacter sp. SYSU D00382]
MAERLFKWIRKYYNIFVHSIGFFPAVFGLLFLAIAVGALELDAAGFGHVLNERFRWLTLKDPETARTIVSTIASGIISLTVFSFSMVMILMNQAASQMSNRMLDNIIGDRVQKVILSFYIGTIVFSLFLLANINDSETDLFVPSISVYLLVLLTIADIFLFVYFLHYFTQSFRYEQLIQRIHLRTSRSLERVAKNTHASIVPAAEIHGQQILSPQSGYFQGFDEGRLLKFLCKHDLAISFLHPVGTFVLQGTPFCVIEGHPDEDQLQRLLLDIDFYYGQEVNKNAYYGFFHLAEVAVKALSPAINDPGTAALSIHALTDLFSQVIKRPMMTVLKDDQGNTRIITKEIPVETLLDNVPGSIWDYGRNDRIVKRALSDMLHQLIFIDRDRKYEPLLSRRLEDVDAGNGFG